MSSSSATLSISPTALKIGQQVDIESRTWPGINKPGGHATITKLHYAHNNNNNVDDGETTNNNNNNDDGTAPIKIDVKYVLGGTEKQIELLYVKPHVELVRGGRSRRVDQKMTVDSFGSAGEKENNGAVGGRKKTASSSGNKRKSGAVENVDKGETKKKVVQKKKKENDTAAAKIEVDKPKIVETDDTEKKTNKSAPPKKEGKKKAPSTTAAAGSSKTKGIASYFNTASSAAAATSTSLSAKAKAVGSSKPSKAVKETTKKVKKTTNPTTKTKPASTKSTTANNSSTTNKNSKQVKYSPNSILAVRAAHAKSPAKSHIFGTKTIGLREGFQFSTTTTASVGGVKGGKKKKKGRGSVQESLFLEQEGEKTPSAASTAAAAVSSSLAASKKKVTPSEKKSGMTSSSSSNNSNSKEKSVQNHKTIQSLYKNECIKAQDFVKSMVGSATKEECKEEEKMMEEDVSSSPESCLELEMDSGRMDLFNSLLTEVMFKKGLDSMEVDELICRINTSPQRGDTSRPFTLLEVKAFLQRLDSQNRIFVSWEEEDNNSGTIYSI